MRGPGFLLDKPWLVDAGEAPLVTPATPAAKLALRVMLVVISVFFILIFVTFIERSQYQDFRALAGEPWQPFTDSIRLWVNTAVLLLASLAMHQAVRYLHREQTLAMRYALAGGALAALVFLVLQVSVWQYLVRLGYGVSDNPANSYYFMLTALHALHLVGGLVALSRVFLHLLRGESGDRMAVAIQACATYWHYLFILWLVLFFMLTRTPEAYATIAALCGLG